MGNSMDDSNKYGSDMSKNPHIPPKLLYFFSMAQKNKMLYENMIQILQTKLNADQMLLDFFASHSGKECVQKHDENRNVMMDDRNEMTAFMKCLMDAFGGYSKINRQKKI